MKKKLRKICSQKATVVDEAKYIVDFIVSTEDPDRHEEVVKQDGWETENFEKNPVVLFGHDSWSFPIGKSLQLMFDEAKRRTIARVQFAAEEYDKAMTTFKLVKGGYLNTTSVGFINKESEGNELTKNELLEISIVPIPANPNAIALAYDTGVISKNEAKWLMKTYETGIESLQKSINNKKEGSVMTEEQEKMLTKTVEKVSQLSDDISVLSQNIQTVVEKLSEAPKKKSVDGDDEEVYDKDGDETEEDQNNDDGEKSGDDDDSSANSDEGDEGADNDDDAEVTDDTEVDPENLTEDQAKYIAAELQKEFSTAEK